MSTNDYDDYIASLQPIKDISSMSFDELYNYSRELREENRILKNKMKECQIKIRQENRHLQNEIDYMKNRKALGVTPEYILCLNEFQEIKNRIAEHAVEIQMLKEKNVEVLCNVLKF